MMQIAIKKEQVTAMLNYKAKTRKTIENFKQIEDIYIKFYQ